MSVFIKISVFKRAMFIKGFNLSDLAKETGVGISYLSQIINGKKIPSPKLAKKISDSLNIDIKELFTFEFEEEVK
ncbi:MULTISPECIES: helix-turn-helix domain-containing protein [Staphylococcus]|uniref:helix-turn-helix domain-containing protein n=1 Tax=Staphylococcus TaxID=1279 RepID=UPI002DB9C791|nr:helix-turn-helix transcriptional regulator [Staphylococcus xylosus]MEB7831015.1 helix-turn-helix transcriptional regulator [Staphylococcus xylosus]